MTHNISGADLTAALPDVTSPQTFPTLKSGAIIRRDLWGIPHIKADNEYDLFFAQGFATAQDRLFQMDFDRLRCLGRIAEYLGESAIQQDTLMRRRRMERVSKLDYAIASPESKAAIDAYTDGVNAFIESSSSLPVEYRLLGKKPERWEPWHCVVVYKVRNTAEGSFQGKLWLAQLAAEIGPERAAKLSPGYQPGSLLTVPPGERYNGSVLNAVEELRAVVQTSSMLSGIDGGSNGWAISGDRTESGLPLIAGDSHRGLEAPNVYYQVHLIGPDFSVLGHSIPGVPMALHFCHNEHIGWGMTHGGVDTQDLYVEKFRQKDGKIEYLYRDAWLQADVSLETLYVSGGEVQVRVVETHHGPVIAGDPSDGAAITLADPGSREGTPWIDAAYGAMKSRSADELEAALEGWTDRVNNYPYADIHGNFGYTLRGRIPVRGSENGWGPVAGWTGEHEWRGYIPASELPRSRNPETGWVVTCNQRVVNENYSHYLTNFFGSGFRAERIAFRIGELVGRKAVVDDMSSIHGDVTSIPAQALQSALIRSNGGFSGKIARAMKLLTEWDCALTDDSSTAALYSMVAAKLSVLVVKANYGSLSERMLTSLDSGAEEHYRRHLKSALVADLESGDESLLPDGSTWNAVLSDAIQQAISDLETRLGTEWESWRWGDLHRSVQQHPLSMLFPEISDSLNPPRVETSGDGDTPYASGARTGVDFTTGSGPVNRYIHDPSDWSQGRWIVPLGASGHPGSPHYADQQQMWAKVQTIPQLWDWGVIGEQAETEQRLTPS